MTLGKIAKGDIQIQMSPITAQNNEIGELHAAFRI